MPVAFTFAHCEKVGKMATTTVCEIPGYPRVYLTEESRQMTIRPMLPTDGEALMEFFRRIPGEDRFYLKEDVTSPQVIARWTENMDYSRAILLLAELDGKIVGDGTLHHRRAGSRRHAGEVRIVVDPEYRNQGVGRGLLHNLIDLAYQKGLEKLLFELVADTEEAARHTALLLGFVQLAALLMAW